MLEEALEEPTLEEMFGDPIIQLLMDVDGLTLDMMLPYFEKVQQRLAL